MNRFFIVLLLLLVAGLSSASAQGVPKHYLSVVGTNSQLVYGARASVQGAIGTNSNASTTYFLKLYDKATAPICGTDTPVATYPLGPNSVPNGLVNFQGVQFANGLGFCITAGIADTDVANAAVGIAVDIVLSGR